MIPGLNLARPAQASKWLSRVRKCNEFGMSAQSEQHLLRHAVLAKGLSSLLFCCRCSKQGDSAATRCTWLPNLSLLHSNYPHLQHDSYGFSTGTLALSHIRAKFRERDAVCRVEIHTKSSKSSCQASLTLTSPRCYKLARLKHGVAHLFDSWTAVRHLRLENLMDANEQATSS